LKEKVFMTDSVRVEASEGVRAGKREALDQLEKNLARLYYTGQFEEYAKQIAEVPGL
jgi:hypothetical protein